MLGERENKMYLTISLGKIRRKSDKDDPMAKSRENKEKQLVYERVFDYVQGKLEDITFYDHKDYGKSWTLHILDGDERYAVQVNEDSRFCADILKKLPNLRKGHIYKFTPYDWEKNNKRKVGVSIEDCATNQKVESYYQKFTEKPDGTYAVENLHGFPPIEGDPSDKDDMKIYFTKVTKFLRTQAQEYMKDKFSFATQEDLEKVNEQIPTDDDLPF